LVNVGAFSQYLININVLVTAGSVFIAGGGYLGLGVFLGGLAVPD
jgi:hypothetical protein